MQPGQPSPFSSQHPPSQDHFEEAKKIEVRPRSPGGGGAAKPAEAPVENAPEVMLNFSCPACLEMLLAPKIASQSAVQCPECSAWVMPPKVVSLVGGSKSMLPPPRKTGNQALRH